MSLRNWTWRNGRKGENPKLAYLLSWQVCSLGFQGEPAGVGARIKLRVGEARFRGKDL